VCSSDLEKVKNGGFARAFAAIGHVIRVRVPNEGKFLEGLESEGGGTRGEG
jgi:hypothetical protein